MTFLFKTYTFPIAFYLISDTFPMTIMGAFPSEPKNRISVLIED